VGRGGTAVLAFLLASIALPACGGDDGDGVSREDYAERVDRVCGDVERELRQLNLAGAETRAEITGLIDDVIVKSRGAVDRVKAIERPEGDAGETAGRFVGTLDRELEQEVLPALEDLKNAIRSGDREAAADAAERLSTFENTESDRFARELGADGCAA
jgi:hypothetical protein